MHRLAVVAAFVLVAAACSSDESTSTTTSVGAPSTTAAEPAVASGDDLVPDPALIQAAVVSGELDALTGDIYMAFALFGGADGLPDGLLGTTEEVGRFPEWDHSATSRLVERWAEIPIEDQTRLRRLIPGIEEFVGGAVSGFRSRRSTDNCFPTSVDVWICIGPSITDNALPDLPLEEAASIVQPWVRDAANDAFPKFLALNLGPRPALVKIYLANLHGNGGYTFGVVPGEQPEGAGGICHLYVDVLLDGAGADDPVYLGDPSIPDGVPLIEEAKATVAHELFHCFQRFAGIPQSNWLYEGTATWAEHHVYPQANTELRYMKPWVSQPGTTFLTRAYDTSFGFVYADLLGGGSGAVVDVLKANSIEQLDGTFPDFWHQISVAAWNQDPADVFVDDGGTVDATVADWGVMPITQDAQETMEFSLPAFSREVQTFEFSGGTSQQELVEFARLALDLSAVPMDVKISALAETAGGWEDPELLTGSERVFCRIAVGPCNDVPPGQVMPYTQIVLIATNTSSTDQSFSVPWNTFNPHLHGTWRRTQGPISLIPGNAAPYWIIDTTLSFDEPELTMSEATGAYTKVDFEDGWTCGFGGSYTVGGDPTYGPPAFSDVAGTVEITGPGSGVRFTNDCIYTTQTGPNPGFETEVSGLHIPVNAAGGPGPFGFEISDNDTLVITGFAVQYVYERVSHAP